MHEQIYCHYNVHLHFRRLTEIGTEITCGEEFYRILVNILRERSIQRVVCLGLGHFSSCPTARAQLAFLLALTRTVEQLTVVQLQDPAFTDPEAAFLRSLDFQVIPENVEGRFSTTAAQPSLYYLPHCPKTLTNNLLLSNWTPEQLQNSVIVCNSFQALLVNTLERDIEKEARHVKRIHEYTKEIEYKSSERHFDSFNDTSIHLFERQSIERIVDPAFWVVAEEDTVTETDPELLTRQLEASLTIN